MMTGVNWSKLITAITAVISVTVLMALGRLDAGSGVPVITLVVGYMLGNGVAAIKNEVVQPVFARRPRPGFHVETIEVPDTGTVHYDIIAGWTLLAGISIAIALGIGWLVAQVI
jgi:hypothetical protein